jgi:hypothetical protein
MKRGKERNTYRESHREQYVERERDSESNTLYVERDKLLLDGWTT